MLKLIGLGAIAALIGPAAFRRLCVETLTKLIIGNGGAQPPLGGCVLKHANSHLSARFAAQPPLGGCVLKPVHLDHYLSQLLQPPLGGCVLKPIVRARF